MSMNNSDLSYNSKAQLQLRKKRKLYTIFFVGLILGVIIGVLLAINYVYSTHIQPGLM